ncbi:hypothetical protein AQI88_07190 [Streptomyces cellostaticus]|uniref:Uncharacterized protein n=1 Tax=Streptomyces cellostaticus TaxID=67285 RepID=A0A101NR64_9ACTN|nr:hypothetical protein AQI88_07190 [Streptomyces cellostaticus]
MIDCGTSATAEPRRRQVDLGPHGLARRVAVDHLPAVGQSTDEQEPAPSGSEGCGLAYILRAGRAFLPGVGHLDPHASGEQRKPQLEVPAGHASMGYGIGGQLGDDHGYGVGGVGAVGDAPGVELGESEVPCQAGAAGG